jgi:hypothetical protein
MCGLAKERVHTSGNDNSLQFALLASGARVNPITRAFGHRQGLASERGLQEKTKSQVSTQKHKPAWPNDSAI